MSQRRQHGTRMRMPVGRWRRRLQMVTFRRRVITNSSKLVRQPHRSFQLNHGRRRKKRRLVRTTWPMPITPMAARVA